MEYGSGLVMFKERVIWCLSRIVEDGYVNWIKGQPDNYRGNEDCAMYWKDLTGWNDSPCSSKINFVCTKK